MDKESEKPRTIDLSRPESRMKTGALLILLGISARVAYESSMRCYRILQELYNRAKYRVEKDFGR